VKLRAPGAHGVSSFKRSLVQLGCTNGSFPLAVPGHPGPPILPVFSDAALLTEVRWLAFSVDVESTFPRGRQNRSFITETSFAAPEMERIPPLPIK
jgi:hypothetical protein